MKRRWLFISLCTVFLAVAQVPASKLDEKATGDKHQAAAFEQEEPKAVFQKLEKNIAAGSLRLFTSFIGPQVYIDVTGGGSGYYSSNQAMSLLQSFFAQRKPLSFKFSSVNHLAPSPYATGRLTYLYKGTRESAQVYVALKQLDSKWVVSQFNIY